ncbi:MAG: flagellar basal body rod protein FlgB [Candidatus Kapabacteria bacterium]|nr:flagellar basal body rod protein FlgB [Candidatus Kapabacteria bacterium]MDW7997552.1 flagellar basal body rod protein FlgB [Bacteroidota bacterium]
MKIRAWLFRERLPLFNRALDTYALRQRVIAENIANATTPGYHPQRVRFEEFFQQQEGVVSRGLRTSERHIPIGPPDPSEVAGERGEATLPEPERYAAGVSHVNVDREMTELLETQIRFRFAARLLARYFQGLQTAIRGTLQ